MSNTKIETLEKEVNEMKSQLDSLLGTVAAQSELLKSVNARTARGFNAKTAPKGKK